MTEVHFEWDEAKNRSNQRKHKVSFEEARSVFLDENTLRFADPDPSADKDRFILLGMSITLRVLVVCHCFRNDDTTIRLISARRANRKEQKAYGG